MKKKWIIISGIMLIIVFNVFSQSTNKIELTNYSGKLKQIGGNWFLNTGEDIVELSLAPDEFLKENEIELTSKMELSLTGIMQEDEFIVYSLMISDKEFKIRDETGEALWKIKPYYVEADKCIGCRLCVSPCPKGAITMVKGVAVIDADKCDGDGICFEGDGKKYKGCPVGAIKQVE
ncbi:MAG: 4Fe-4S binding protein [Candidatus Cloacimonetes bacterium]|jgi:ferredoxin|nr:4Fe-4S binding protein [Candidatus Cloacimonadota bacterium]MBT4575435.1 4Fe-4S binding protein [Candidatus Cloacimonadota bacterium]